MIAPDSTVFPNALVAPPAIGESAAELWRRAEITRAWRRAQLDQGLVEVPVTGTQPDERSQPPEDGLRGPDGPDRFDDFGLLTGLDPSG